MKRYIYQGLLDFDRQFLDLPRNMKKLVPITIIYPNQEFHQQQSSAVPSQQALKDDAEEHYLMLKALAMTDSEYQRQLK